MKLPHLRWPTSGNGPPQAIPGSQRDGFVAPLDVLVRHCESNCLRLADPALRERCLHSCGYPAEL